MTQTPVSTLQPALTLTEFVDTTGVFPSHGGSGSGPFLASIGVFAGPSYLFNTPAQGQTYTIVSNTALFSLLGTNFGGNGTSNFGLPNLGGVETIGAGQGAGFPLVSLGQTLGQTSYNLTTAQLPPSLGGTSAAIDARQPSLGLNYVINAYGVYPSGSLTLDSLGVVSAFAGNFAPGGELFCNGQLLPISQYTALFSLIGTTYGGDGVTTFALPDLRGRDIVGAGSGFTLGEQVGAANVTLTNANSPLGPDAPVDTQQPGLVMNYYIALQGIFPSQGQTGNSSDQSTPFLGQIVACAETITDPKGWALCNGQLLSIAQNQALFALLGTTYGGNGTTTFALPDLQGRTVLGTGGANGLGSLGEVSGANAISLTSANLPALAAPTIALADDTGAPHAPGHTTDGRVNVSGIAPGAVWSYSTDGGATFTTGAGTSLALTGDGVKTVLVNQSWGSDVSPNASLTFTLEPAPPNFFNSDDKADILWQNANGDVELWNSNSGLESFAGRDLGVVGGDWQIAGTGDFNGVGEAGILWRNFNGDVTLWNANGSGGFVGKDLGVVGASWQIAGTGDFNESGEGILWRNANGDTALWNANGSGGFVFQDLGVVGGDWQIAGTGDFTGTGETSIVWRNANGDTELWNPNGAGGFKAKDLGAVGASWQIAGTGDFTGTGEESILWRNANGDTALWNPNGSGGFVFQDLRVVGNSWQIVGTGDFTGTGESSILWRNASGDTALWNPNGSGGFAFQDLGEVGPNWSVHKIFA
jgi:microcystin-dependent protein